MRYFSRKLGPQLLSSGIVLSMVFTAVSSDQWGDNGSTPIGGGNGGGPGGPNPGGGPGPKDGEPVSIYTGQYTLDSNDINVPGRFPLVLHRQYRSANAYQGMFGRGWNCDYNERILVLATNGNLLLRRANTQLDTFTNLNNNSYMAPAGCFDALVRNLDGSYTLRDTHGNYKQYNVNGCLTEMRDRNGNQLLLTYDPGGKEPINAISDYSHITNAILIARDYRLTHIEVAYNYVLSGRYLQFTYDPNGRVTNVMDFTGRAWTYAYDALGNGTLTSVTTPPAAGFPAGLLSRYTYDPTNHLLLTVTDQSNNALLTNSYDSQGRIIQQLWGNAVWSFGYPTATDRWVTNGSGYLVDRIFDTNALMLERRDYTAGLHPGDPIYFSTKYSYTNSSQNYNQQSKVIFPSGNVTAARYDSFGNLLELRRKAADVPNSPSDLVSTATYDPVYNFVQTVTDARSNVTTYVYDYQNPAFGTTNGNLMQIILPAIGPGAPTLSYSYNIYGQFNTFTNATGAVTKFIYDSNGYVIQRIDGFGSAAAATNIFTVDSRGNILTATDPRGNVTTNIYDNLDRLVQVISPAPFYYVTQYSYTGNGKLAQILVQTGNPAHPWQTNAFTYDLLDHTAAIMDGAGNFTRFYYDANGNQTNTVDANGIDVTNLFDERKLLWKVIDGLADVTTYDYTLNGKLGRTTDARGNAVTYAYDAYDRLTGVTYPDLSAETYLPDPNGNIIARRSRAGIWLTNTYDVLNNIATKTYPDGSTVAYQYDLSSRQVAVIDTNGVISMRYNALGRLTAATNTLGKGVTYQYDSVGNRARMIDPEGQIIDYRYDSLNRLTNVVYDVTNSLVAYTYDALGRRISEDFGNGIVGTLGYDLANNPTNLNFVATNTATTLGQLAFTYDNAGNRLSMQTTGGLYPGLHTYTYDHAYQLTQVQYPAGYPFPGTVYNYDRTANRTNVNNGASVVYTPNTLNQYTTVGGQAYSYSANGNLTSDSVALYNYDDENRLTFAAKAGTNVSYSYDAYGQRTKKNVNGTARNFVYDSNGAVPVLLGEYDAVGNPLVKYVFVGARPVAVVVGGAIYSCHCDHLPRPLLMTDRTGALVWQANYDAFGQAALGAGNTADVNLRSAGQYEDKETGLFYNLARFYNPRIGRYQSFDPAMEATSPLFTQVQGANAYAYVGNNPVNAADPNGNISLFFIICSGPLLPVCSVSLICSGQAGGLCSAGVICSGQLGSGVGACSASVIACSGQAGYFGASACSANIAGACSAQAGLVGAGVCSAQGAGACSAQVGNGGSGCSANGAGACSAQLGAGVSECSAQGAGACSAQYGPGESLCSAQGAGACSAQSDLPGPSLCSASNCKPKKADNWSPPEDGPQYASSRSSTRRMVTALAIERQASGSVEIRFVTHGYNHYRALASGPGATASWTALGDGLTKDDTVTRFAIAAAQGSRCEQVKLRLESAHGEPVELGPFALGASPPVELQPVTKNVRSTPFLAALLPWLAALFSSILLTGKSR